LEFDQIHIQHKLSHIIYADFEAIQEPYQPADGDEADHGSVQHKTIHKVCSFAFAVIGPTGELADFQQYRNPDALEVFIDRLQKWETKINKIKRDNLPFNPNDVILDGTCFICRQPVDPDTEQQPETIVILQVGSAVWFIETAISSTKTRKRSPSCFTISEVMTVTS